LKREDHIGPFQKDLLSAKRRALSIIREDLVKIFELGYGQTRPLVIEPRINGVDLALWIRENRELISTYLSIHGGILFRKFGIHNAAGFEDLIQGLSGDLMNYAYQSTPRDRVQGNIYTSTTFPKDQQIPLHNENSYTNIWPMKIWFFCQQPTISGGQTPIADSRLVYQRLDPEIRSSFSERHVKYVRNYGEGIDLPWQKVFQTSDRSEVESYCREMSIGWQWSEGARLRTWQVQQAVAQHPQTGEKVWFNQAHLFHITNLGREVQESLMGVLGPEYLPRQAYYGDGREIEEGVLAEIKRTYEEVAVEFMWERGDVLLLDNMLMAHGRRSFTGSRRVLVGMAEAYHREAVLK
jgi:alpha-ketoglutarate-dependent taurine dioxygenase